MPRQARVIRKNNYYHIIFRGNNKQTLFQSHQAFDFFLNKVHFYALKFDVSIYHYCLMSNHGHFIMKSRVTDGGITKMMHGLQTSYARFMQNHFDFTGHIFENRYKHFHVHSESYLLECGRYIELNPVRANIVLNPVDYPWSSASFYISGKANCFLHENPLFVALGSDINKRRQAYLDYVMRDQPYDSLIDEIFVGRNRDLNNKFDSSAKRGLAP